MNIPPAARLVPAILAFGGVELVPLEPADAAQVLELLERRGNRYLLELGSSQHEVAQLLAQLAQATWSLPLAMLNGDDCVGMATTALPNLRSLNASILTLFTDPPNSSTALALYLRHVFWNFPLHRLHVQIPALDLTAEYIDLYRSVGFREEGRLVDHAIVGGQTFDVVTMGLLRSEFVGWCQREQSELALE